MAEQEEIKRDNSIRDLRIKIQSTEICIKKLECGIVISIKFLISNRFYVDQDPDTH